ncbi:MAG: hypothetical protein GKR89_27355 [Candidatus Latescibacteria bacterium]|nr:hypothetical protein [Candidatus Latescibacterota bacterium]
MRALSLQAFCSVALVGTALWLAPFNAVAAPALTTEPVKWFDADDKPIPEPVEIVENQIWDIADHTFFYQVGKVLDLGWSARRLGNLLNVVGPRQADNTNALDETVGSSWYSNRHFMHRMSVDELAVGPGRAVPDHSGPWEIVAGKFEGGTAGFTIKDPSGAYFLLKFDSEGNNEMGSAAEVIATKVLYAAGYNVPRNSVVYFDPGLLVIGPKAKVPTPDGRKRPMEEADMQAILDNIIPQPDGRLRCVASAFLQGKPVGIFEYHGTRKDDPNDRVDHQHRRELRGLRVIGSWMNDADRRAANTLDMYVERDGGGRYVKHFIIDMGSAFGSNNLMPHLPKYGNEYVWDPRTVFRSLVSLGLYRKPWEEPLPMQYPTLGYFENETFDAGSWVPTYPNPAFERCTNRDGYWGAKLVMNFTDAELAAMVATGHYSDPGAAAELVRLLAERRDMIGRYWFARINPLDRFRVEATGLHFDDLALASGLQEEEGTRYNYRLLDSKGNSVGSEGQLQPGEALPLGTELAAGQYHGYQLRTRRSEGGGWSKYTRVYFYKSDDSEYQIVRLERQE